MKSTTAVPYIVLLLNLFGLIQGLGVMKISACFKIARNSLKYRHFNSHHHHNNQLPDCILLNDHYIDQASSLIADAFPLVSKYSWARALGLKNNNLKPYLTDYLKDHIHRSYGISMAIDNDNNISGSIENNSKTTINKESNYDPNLLPNLSGVVITEVQTISSMMDDIIKKQQQQDNISESIEEEYNAYGAIEGILNECTRVFYQELKNRGYIGASSDNNLKYGYISWIATKVNHRGNGIAGNLINTCSHTLKNTDNCSLITAYCVSPKATKVFLNQGFTIWGQIPYQSYIYKNRIPYQILPDEISIVVKDLTVS